MLRVITANVNGIRAAARRGGIGWLEAQNPTVLTLQEVRGTEDHLRAALAGSRFESWHVTHAESHLAGRNGVAILTEDEPLATRTGLPGFDSDGRWLEADIADEYGVLTVISAYVHTGEAETDRQVEKHRFLDAMQARLDELAARSDAGEGEALLTGDLNIAHRDFDIKNWKGNLKKSGFLPSERAYLDRWFGYGWDGVPGSSGPVSHTGRWVDLGRMYGGDGPGPYTWWSWRGKAFDNDSGWRIDYQIATQRLAARSRSAVVGRAPSYAERWSDHAPLTVDFD